LPGKSTEQWLIKPTRATPNCPVCGKKKLKKKLKKSCEGKRGNISPSVHGVGRIWDYTGNFSFSISYFSGFDVFVPFTLFVSSICFRGTSYQMLIFSIRVAASQLLLTVQLL